MKRLFVALAVALSLFSCATAGRSIAYYHTNASDPKETQAQIFVGAGTVIASVNGEPTNGDLMRDQVSLPAGTYDFGLKFHYELIEGKLTTTWKLDDEVKVTLTVRGGESWFLGPQYSRSMLDKPYFVRPATGATEASPSFADVSDVRFVARQLNIVPTKSRTTFEFYKVYAGAMTPFYSADGKVLFFSEGGVLNRVEIGVSDTPTKVKISDADLIAGGVRTGSVYFLDAAGGQFLLDPATSRVEKLDRLADKPQRAEVLPNGIFVQTSNTEIKKIAEDHYQALDWIKTKIRITTWSVASGSGEAVVLTYNVMTRYNPQGTATKEHVFALDGSAAIGRYSNSLAVSPSGDLVAFTDIDSHLRYFARGDWDSSPKDVRDLVGNSAVRVGKADAFVWQGEKRLFVFAGTSNGEPCRIQAFDLAGPNDGSKLDFATDPRGCVLAFDSNWVTANGYRGVVSPDGTKATLMMAGGPLGVPAFFFIESVDFTRNDPKN